VGNDLVHAGSHARPQAVDRGMPSQGAPNGVAMNDGSLLVPNKVPRTNRGVTPCSLIIVVIPTAVAQTKTPTHTHSHCFHLKHHLISSSHLYGQQGVSVVRRIGLDHLLRNPQLFIFHVPQELMNSFSSVQLLTTQQQWLEHLRKPNKS